MTKKLSKQLCKICNIPFERHIDIELLIKVKEKNWKSDKKCTECIYYVDNYRDDYTLKHFGYGKVKYRPACSHGETYHFVSHNPAAHCRHYHKEVKKSGLSEFRK